MPLIRDIPTKEALRYLGMGRNGDLDPDSLALLNTCAAILAKESTPKYVSAEFDIDINGDKILIGDTLIRSKGLARNLKCCSKAVLIAVTIGPACDRLVKRAQIKSNLEAAMYQALGAAAVEDYIDSINEEIAADYAKQGLYARPRYSPGYGDLALSHQKDWFRMLDITKNTGITLLDSLLMVPTKSVTAVIGLASEPTKQTKHDCSECTMSKTCFASNERN